MRDGIDYRAITCLGDSDDLDIHVVRIDPRKWKLDTVVHSGANARDLARSKHVPFAINTNFFDKARQPIGIILRDGDLVQKPSPKDWQSIFFLNEEGRPRIVLPDKWSANKDGATMAVQAGPRLVVEGEPVKLTPTYAAPRAGVCVQWDRDLLFFAMPKDRKLHTTEMAAIAVKKEAEGGLRCRNAMLFDGGHSVNFYVDGEEDDDAVSVNQDPVPVYIVATPIED